MRKLVALEQIKGLMSGTVYAEKYDEVELMIKRLGVSQYKNVRTGFLLDARDGRIGMVDEFDIAAYIPQKEKRTGGSNKKGIVKDNKQQTELF